MSDYSQKRSDEARSEHDRRQSDRARFGSYEQFAGRIERELTEAVTEIKKQDIPPFVVRNGIAVPLSDFAAFATDLTRTNGLVLSKPAQLFGVPPLPDPNLAAAVADEFFTEGRNHRRAPAPVNIAET